MTALEPQEDGAVAWAGASTLKQLAAGEIPFGTIEAKKGKDHYIVPLFTHPAPTKPSREGEVLDATDLQTLLHLKRDNTWDGSRPVLERPRSDPETERAFALSERGLIALEQVARGVRLHITRKGVQAIDAALSGGGDE